MGGWSYEPSRKTPSGVINYVRENLSVVKNLAGYVLPGELKSVDELAPGARRDPSRRPAQDCRLPRHRRKPPSAFGHLHAFGMRSRLELYRAMLGLLVPWLAFRSGWHSLERASGTSPGACRRCGSRAVVMCTFTPASMRAGIGQGPVRRPAAPWVALQSGDLAGRGRGPLLGLRKPPAERPTG